MIRTSFVVRYSAATLIALLVAGCGGGGAPEGGVPTYPASGTVTMFGSPLANATVAFAPQQGQPTAIATTDASGNFTLRTYEFGDGAAEGNFKVVISKASAPAGGGGDAADSGHGDDYDSGAASAHSADGAAGDKSTMVPAQYSSSKDTPLSATVKADEENTFTFTIE